MATIRPLLRGILSLSIYATFFLTGWWLRLTRFDAGYPSQPFVLGFLVTLPVLLAFICWLLLGMPGLGAALRDSRRWWLLWLALLTFWALISPYWSAYPLSAYSASAQFLAVSVFALVVTCAAPPPKWIAIALALGVILLGVVSIGQFYAQRAIGLPLLGEFEINLQRQGVSIVRAGSETILRPYGLQPHPNITAGSLAVGLLALSGWLHGAKEPHPRPLPAGGEKRGATRDTGQLNSPYGRMRDGRGAGVPGPTRVGEGGCGWRCSESGCGRCS
jgi:hypothetical protein